MMPAKTPSGPAERARLIPVAGIGTHEEAERRAASALLAVLTVARDLSRDLLTPLGASKAGKAVVEAYTEVRYDLGGGRPYVPTDSSVSAMARQSGRRWSK